MKKIIIPLAIVLVLSFSNVFAAADVCAPYYGKGYCVDYIKLKTGKKQSGNAENWYGNVNKTDAKSGDVAIFSSGHVARIDSVNKDKKKKVTSVNVSEWNYGKASKNSTEKYCRVTDKFHKVTYRTIAISNVSRVWRP